MPEQLNRLTTLHQRKNTLHTNPEVELVVNYLRNSGDKISHNDPSRKLGAWLSFLANRETVNDGIFTGDEQSIDRQIEARVITAANVPQSYFDLQQKIARQRGHGTVHMSDSIKNEYIRTLQEEQQESLHCWTDYFNGQQTKSLYPDWFKYYVWDGIGTMGQFVKPQLDENGNEIEARFTKRTLATTAPYPECNAEALAYVYETIGKNEKAEDNRPRFDPNTSFAKLYAYALTEATQSSMEVSRSNDGSWKKYDRIDGYYRPDYEFDDTGEATDKTELEDENAMQLAASLRGYGTGWCTAGTRTAAHQLSSGDFYVFYSQDEEGNDKIPRVAIRMENEVVAEVRGVLNGQELEPELFDTVQAKLGELPGGQEYYQKVENMRRLTAIDLKVEAGQDLDIDDIEFLYTTDIVGFGYHHKIDPRVEEIMEKRKASTFDDLEDIGREKGVDIAFEAARRRFIGLEFITNHLTEIINKIGSDEFVKKSGESPAIRHELYYYVDSWMKQLPEATFSQQNLYDLGDCVVQVPPQSTSTHDQAAVSREARQETIEEMCAVGMDREGYILRSLLKDQNRFITDRLRAGCDEQELKNIDQLYSQYKALNDSVDEHTKKISELVNLHQQREDSPVDLEVWEYELLYGDPADNASSATHVAQKRAKDLQAIHDQIEQARSELIKAQNQYVGFIDLVTTRYGFDKNDIKGANLASVV